MPRYRVSFWAFCITIVVALWPPVTRVLASEPPLVGTSGGAPAGAGDLVVGGIAATPELQGVLRKVREALGGNARLLGVRSLSLDSNLTFVSQPPRPYLQLMLLPDRFLERRSDRTTVLDGAEYWQLPEPPPDPAAFRQAATRTFVTQCLLFLLRAPGSLPLHASRSGAEAGVIGVEFEGPGGLHRNIEIDAATMRLRAVSSPAVLQTSSGTTRGTSRTSIEEYRRIDGIWFPVRTRTLMEAGHIDMSTTYGRIRVNEGVKRSDFVRK